MTTIRRASEYGLSDQDVPARVGSSLSRLSKLLSAWRQRRRQSAELHALSDAALKDFGVSRWEIDSIVNSPNRDTSGRVRNS